MGLYGNLAEMKINPVFYMYSPLTTTTLRKWLAKTRPVLMKQNLKTHPDIAVVDYIIVIVRGIMCKH